MAGRLQQWIARSTFLRLQRTSCSVHTDFSFDALRPASALSILVQAAQDVVGCRRHSLHTAAASPVEGASSTPLDFGNFKAVYSRKGTAELMRSYLVFKACTFPSLVLHADALLSVSKKLLGSRITSSIVRQTFFKHFCAGENAEDILPTIRKLHEANIGAILDYAAEDDVQSEKGPASRADPAVKTVVARTYDYQSEVRCDRHVDIFMRAIQAVPTLPGSNFAAIKVTALGNPLLLERMSTALLFIRDLFRQFDIDGSGFISQEEFRTTHRQLFSEASDSDIDAWFKRLGGGDGPVDYVAWTQRIRLQDAPGIVARMIEHGGDPHPSRLLQPLAAQVLTDAELALVDAMLARVRKLCEAAAALDVRLMIDAEHSYFQPAIDHVALQLMREFNVGGKAVVFTTYQAYLKDARQRLMLDMERAARGGYRFACKLVRGAYVVLERKRAEEMGYASPVWERLEETHNNYNTCMEAVLQNVAQHGCTEVMLATHNQRSVELAVEMIGRLGLSPRSAPVYFGQLLGMSDHLTFTLGQNGYKAFKYVPYGPIAEVMPYLIRRAQENSTVLGSMPQELVMLRKELARRVKDALPFPTAQAAKA